MHAGYHDVGWANRGQRAQVRTGRCDGRIPVWGDLGDGFARHLTGEPVHRDVDLLIRTGGEKRLSDFLLWECAYAELYFTDRLWPDFSAEDLATAVAAFNGRERRFGGLGPSAVSAA